MKTNYECPKCGRGVLGIIDIQEDKEDSQNSRVIIGCDECRHVEHISVEEAKGMEAVEEESLS